MKKNMGIKRALDVIPSAELSHLPTGALLARLKRLRWCLERSEDANDYSTSDLKNIHDKILFKPDERWKQAYADVKSILDTREHKRNMT